jgi:hypothetical protein
VPALCAGDKELKDLDPGCGIDERPMYRDDEHTRKWVRIARLECRRSFLPFAHHDCSCNQVIALRNRVLGAVPAPTRAGLEKLRKQARMISRLLPRVTPQEWYEMPNQYSGGKRANYIRATDRVLSEGGLTKQSARIKMFVKFEKLNPSKVNPDPRAIQFRDPKYCVAVGRFLKACEHPLYRLHGDGKILPATRVIGKGLSQAGRAKLLVEKMKAFNAPMVVSLDASRFDQHVSKELLQIEHSVYLAMCDDPEFRMLLRWQLDNKGVSSRGIKYHTRGKRMSGDMNTALGNCLLMVTMVSAIMKGKHYDILDDGDDCLLIIEQELFPWCKENLYDEFLAFGMEIKLENEATTIEEVEWCQSHPIEYAPGKHKFVRDPIKGLSTGLGGVKYLDSERVRRKLVNTIGMAEMTLNLGVPVMQSYAMALMRNASGGGRRERNFMRSRHASQRKSAQLDHVQLTAADPMYFRVNRELRAMNLKQLERLDPQPITDTARMSFARAFDISVEEQLEMESYLDSWTFPITGCQDLQSDYDVPSWSLSTASTPEAWPMRE